MDGNRVVWIKCVTRHDGIPAYLGEDPGALHREPTSVGDEFEVHCSVEASPSLGRPGVGDLLCLVQHGRLTHVVEVVGGRVDRRPAATIRRGNQDRHYPCQRTCRAIAMAPFASAPRTATALGFDPNVQGGDVLAIADLLAFRNSGLTLGDVQARVSASLRRDG